jgi:hypothetical protein
MPSPARRSGRGGGSELLCTWKILPSLDHSVQVRRRILDVGVLVLTRATFRNEHAAAVDIGKIPIRKFVAPLGIVGLFVVDPQISFAVFGKTMKAKELIFPLCGRPMLVPRISVVEYDLSFRDEGFRVVICSAVKRHGHGKSPFRSFCASGEPIPL